MKKYNFDKSIDRRKTHSYKWDIKEDELSFSIADSDFMVADEIQEAVIKRAKEGTYGYTYAPKEYFEAYIYWWKLRYNTALKLEWFIFSSGVVSSIDSIIKRVTNVGEKVATFSPDYNVFYNCIENNKRIVEEVPLKYEKYAYSIDWNILENSLKESKAFILCNPHNPTGYIFNKDELIKIAKLCEKYNVYLITDEIHCDLDYNQKRYTPLLSAANYNKVIMLASPAKTFNLAGLHSSVIIVPKQGLKEILQKGVYEDDIGEPSYFSIEPVIAAYTKGEQYVKELNEYLYENKRNLEDFLAKNGLNLKIVGGETTYLLWIDISAYSSDSIDFAKRLKEEEKIIVCDGKRYHEKYSSFIRVNIATQKENIQKLCIALKSFCKEK